MPAAPADGTTTFSSTQVRLCTPSLSLRAMACQTSCLDTVVKLMRVAGASAHCESEAGAGCIHDAVGCCGVFDAGWNLYRFGFFDGCRFVVCLFYVLFFYFFLLCGFGFFLLFWPLGFALQLPSVWRLNAFCDCLDVKKRNALL